MTRELIKLQMEHFSESEKFCSCSNFWTSSISNHFECEPPKCMLKSYPNTLKHKKVWVRMWPVSCPNPPLSIISCHLSSINIYSESHTTSITLIGLYKESFVYACRLDNFVVCIYFKRLMQWIMQTKESVSVWLAEFYTVSTYL